MFCRISESLYAHSGANWSMEKQCDAYAEAIAFATRVWAGNAEAARMVQYCDSLPHLMSIIVPFEGGDPGTSLFFARRSGGAARPVSFSPTMPSRDLRFPAGRERSLESQTTRLPIYRSRMRPDQPVFGSARCLSPSPRPTPDAPHNFIQSPLSLTRRVVEDSPSLSSWKSRMEAEVSGDTVTQGSLWAPPASPVHSPPNPMIRRPRDGRLPDSPGYRGPKPTVHPPAYGQLSPVHRDAEEVSHLDWLSSSRAPKDCLAPPDWRDDSDYMDQLSRSLNRSRQVRWT